MVAGRIKKFFAEVALLEQECLLDDKKRTVAKIIQCAALMNPPASHSGRDFNKEKQHDAEIVGFRRLRIGEGVTEE